MKFVLKAISALLLLSIPVYLVFKIDPNIVKDVGMAGLYLPFTVSVGIATLYCSQLLVKNLILSVIITSLLMLGLYLSIWGILTIFTACVILALIFFAIYVFNRH